MNANVSIYQDSIKDSSGILTSESNEIGSLKIIMPDKLNQLTARSSYICHIDDFVVSISVPSKSVINNLHFFMIQNLNDI